MITEIAFTGIPVTDIGCARAFYEGVLGLKNATVSADGNWIEYDVGAGTLGIALYPGWEPSAQGTNVALEVDNLDAEVSRLRAQGVTIHLDITDTAVCRFAIIRDPDGNKIVVHKRKSQA